MSEEAVGAPHNQNEPIRLTPEVAPKDAQAAAWDRIMNPPAAEEAITAEAVSGEPAKAEEAAPVASDRDLVAPQLATLLRRPEEAKPEPEPEPENLTPDQLILRKLEKLEQEKIEAETAREEAEREARFTALRDQLLSNVETEKEALPGFYALEQQDTLVQLVAQYAEAGEEVSEFEIARQIEEKAVETYHKLHAVYGNASTPSEEPAPSAPATPEPTISNQLVSAEAPVDLEGLSPKERQAAIWDSIMNRG